MNRKTITAVILIIGILWGLGLRISFEPACSRDLLAWAQTVGKEFPLKVFFNGKESTIRPKSEKGENLFPLNLPFREGTTRWEVEFNWDSEKNVLKADTKYIHPKPLGKVREEWHQCNICGGTGKCQHCYPVGSGRVYGDESAICTWCNGTGKCWYCGGAGGWK